MKLNKTIFTYIFITIAVFLFDKIYTLFGHGVTSNWMSNAYLYVFCLGVLVFVLFRLFIPHIVNYKGYALFFRIYNSGIAILINGMLLYGIIEIAGGSSSLVSWFITIGSGLLVIAAVLAALMLIRKSKDQSAIEQS
jgi:hypothetical protein